VAALETLAPDRIAEQVEQLAHHALRGEVWDKALVYSRQTGAKAFARSANREAVANFEQALIAMRHLPDSRNLHEHAVDLRFDLRNALLQLGDHRRIHDHLHEAETLARHLGDQRRLGWVFSYMAQYYTTVDDHERAVTAGQQALTIAEALGDFALRVATNFFLSQPYHCLGNYREAVDCCKRNVAVLTGEQRREYFGIAGLASVFSRTRLTWSLSELGAFAEGIAWGEEGIRIAEEADHPFSRISAYHGLGYLYLRQGDFSKAIPLFEQSLALYQAANILVYGPIVTTQLGYAYALSGQVDKALPLLEPVVDRGATLSFMGHALRVSWLGEAYLLAGRLEDANTCTGHALDLSRAHQERGHQAYALRLLGDIAARHEPPEAELAETHYCQALALAEALGMRPLQAHCHLGLGTLYARLGQREPARAALSTAMELYRSMDMTFWLPQGEAAMAKVE
jgi:tetratricopeptide (TPR) repeat protein